MIEEITDASALVYDGVPTVVCFTNPLTCAPCKLLDPHYKAAAESFATDGTSAVRFAEVNVLDHMDIAAEFGVMGTPTVLFISENGVTNVKARTTLPLINEIAALLNA